MRRNRLGKLYDRLTPEERFRLDVAATARGNVEESRRLTETCPRRTYTMNDAAYSGRWEASQLVTMVVCLDLAPRLAKMAVVSGFAEALPLTYETCGNEGVLAYVDGLEAGRKAGWEAAGGEGDPPEKEEDPETEDALSEIRGRIGGASERFAALLENVKLDLASEALAVWEAFSSFCRDLELDPEQLVKVWCEPALTPIGGLLEEFAGEIEPNWEKVEEYRQALEVGWRRTARTA